MGRRIRQMRRNADARSGVLLPPAGPGHPLPGPGFASRSFGPLLVATSIVAVLALTVAGFAVVRAEQSADRGRSIAKELAAAQRANAQRIKELHALSIDPDVVLPIADASIVTIYCDNAQGTAFAVDVPAPSGYITTFVTAAHVVKDCGTLQVYLTGQTNWVPGHITAIDNANDLASFASKVEVPALTYETVMHIGDPVAAVGTPYGYAATLTIGVVGTYYDDVIVTDVALNPGSSGGPLLDRAGKVLGIALSTLGRDGTMSEFAPLALTCERLFSDCPFI